MRKDRILQNTFFAQLWACIFSSLASTIGSMVDGVIIGQYLGSDSIAAFGVISPLLTVFSVFGAIVATGSRTRFTKLIGEGKVKDAQSVFSLSCILSIGLATLMMVLILPFASPFAALLGASGNAASLLPKATDYLIGIAIGLPAMNAMKTLVGYMPIDNDRHLPVVASIVLTVSDIIFDLLVVVMHGDTFEMGLATSLSYYAAVIVLLTHFRKKNILLRFSIKNIRWRDSLTIIRKGAPVGVCRFGNTLRSASLNHLLAVIASTSAIAAYSVHRQADSFLNPIMLGMAETVCMMAGIILGEEDRPLMKRLLRTSVRATMVFTLGVAVIAWFFAPVFAQLFIKDNPEALELSIAAVRCYAVGMPFYGLNVIYQEYLQGIERSKLSLIAGFMLEAGFLIISAWVMSAWFGANAVWYAFPVTQGLMFIFYAVLITVESRRLNIRGEGVWNKILMLPPSFDVPEENQMEGSITSMDEVMEMSKTVWDFCKSHGCDTKRTYLISLSVEEMAGNIVTHGFPGDDKENIINVRLIKNDDLYIIRIRDDCPVFDPVKQLELFSEEDPAHHLGLRMTASMAKEFKYTNIMKLNNLLIKV